MVKFILKRDRDAIFQFASLQSLFAKDILAREHADVAALDSFYIVLNYDPIEHSANNLQPAELLLSRSDAVLFVIEQLGGIWRPLALIMRVFPHTIRDWAYCLAARHRYRIYGRYDACPLPTEATRSRFLDL